MSLPFSRFSLDATAEYFLQMESDGEEADLTTSTLAPKRTACLESLSSLSEDLFTLRDRVAACLPGYTAGEGTVKRRRVAHGGGDAEYWRASADDSLRMVDSYVLFRQTPRPPVRGRLTVVETL